MPRSDNSAQLRELARRRSAAARARAEHTLSQAHRESAAVTVAGIARQAGVSRAWLYTQPDLLDAIGKLKGRSPSPARTGRQPASTASLQQRLETALHRAKQLRAQNRELTQQLEIAHGEIRRLRTQQPRDASETGS